MSVGNSKAEDNPKFTSFATKTSSIRICLFLNHLQYSLLESKEIKTVYL